MKEKRVIQIFSLALIMLLIACASYAYFVAQISDASSTDITVTTATVDNLTFETGDAISVYATQDNFGEGDGNQSGSTYASATLVANNDTNEASANYYVYLHITENTFSYTTDDETAEILLNVYDPDGNEVTSLDGLTYTTVTDGNGSEVSGFDITTYSGILTIAEYYEIISTGSNTQEWNITVTLVNLDSNQVNNGGASFGASLIIQSGVFYSYNTLQAKVENSEIWLYLSTTKKIVFDDNGSTVSEYDYVYDLSDEGNESILAYLVNNEDDTYTIYIVSDLPIQANESMYDWFYGFELLESIEGLDKLITSNVTDMQFLFQNCISLTELDLSSWDTSNVTNMAYMFSSVNASSESQLENIIFGENWDTSNVTDMEAMFYRCTSLTSLDLSGFNTSKVENMNSMFMFCWSLTTLDISGWNTSSVTDMSYMFASCHELKSLDVSSFDTSSVTNMSQMFGSCESLIDLNMSVFNTSNVTDMSGMFSLCISLTSLDLSSFDTSSVTNMNNMFAYCSSLASLDLSSFDTSNVTNMAYMFAYCSSLASLDLSSFDTSNVTNMAYMFEHCGSLTSLDLSSFDTSSVTSMNEMFYYCTSLTFLNLSNADFSNVTTYSYMFSNANSSITVTVKDSTAYDFITAVLGSKGTVVIA